MDSRLLREVGEHDGMPTLDLHFFPHFGLYHYLLEPDSDRSDTSGKALTSVKGQGEPATNCLLVQLTSLDLL